MRQSLTVLDLKKKKNDAEKCSRIKSLIAQQNQEKNSTVKWNGELSDLRN